MTRFARVSLKSSNKKAAEEPTPWHELKGQIQSPGTSEEYKKAEKIKDGAKKTKTLKFKEREEAIAEESNQVDQSDNQEPLESPKKKQKKVKICSEGKEAFKERTKKNQNKDEIERTIKTEWAQWDDETAVCKKKKREYQKDSLSKPKTPEDNSGSFIQLEEPHGNSEKQKKKKRKKSEKFEGNESALKDKWVQWKDSSTSSTNFDIKKLGRQKIPDQNVELLDGAKIESKSTTYARRKPNVKKMTVNIQGEDTKLVKFDGFFVKKSDAKRLKSLRETLTLRGLPEDAIKSKLRLERRKAEKALSREKKRVCLICRKGGHSVSNCPENKGSDVQTFGTDLCYKCGSTEHRSFQCRAVQGDKFGFATCFICKESGHIAKQCPDNPRGLYPNGGACRSCGDVTHLRQHCPKFAKPKPDHAVTAETFVKAFAIEGLDGEIKEENPPPSKPKNKKIKFF